MNKQKAFTLIELAIVLLVLGTLAGLMLRNVGMYTVQARDAKRKGDLRNLSVNLVQYNSSFGQYPAPAAIVSELQKIGVANLPSAPRTIESYDYVACMSTGVTFYNHFILRTRLEQTSSTNPNLYSDSYNSSSLPPGWVNCSAVSFNGNNTTTFTGTIIDCSANNNYYCVAQ